jgi:hypothetical protein
MRHTLKNLDQDFPDSVPLFCVDSCVVGVAAGTFVTSVAVVVAAGMFAVARYAPMASNHEFIA